VFPDNAELGTVIPIGELTVAISKLAVAVTSAEPKSYSSEGSKVQF
jgi:hypothetical protein